MDPFEKHLDYLIPRGGKKPNHLYVSLEEYISRVAMLARKIKGLKYRKECWDKVTSEHLAEFKEMTNRLSLNRNIEDLPFRNAKSVFLFSLRDVRLENEFEVFIYSLRNALTITTRLVSSFLSGRTSIHSHSKLRDNLNKTGDWPALVKLINLACENWIDELTERRDAATHYVALTTTSLLTSELQKPNDYKIQQNTVLIPKQPLKYVSLWWDDIPTIGGTSTASSIITNSDGDSIEKYELFDNEENLLVSRECKPPDVPESIDGINYCNDLMQNFESYFVELASELVTKLN